MRSKKEIYIVEVDGKISTLGYSNLKDAQAFMKQRAKQMNTFQGKDPDIGLAGATYYYVPRNDINDPFKEGYIKILFVQVKE